MENKYKLQNKTEFIFSDEFIGFTTIPNYIFNTKELSYRAIGIYCSILQFQNSPNHIVTLKGLASRHKEGRDAIAKAIDELIQAGFIEKIQMRENGKFTGVLYKMHMKPFVHQGIAPIPENPNTENPNSENPTHKKKIDKKENTKKENTTSLKPKGFVVDPTIKDLIETYTSLQLTAYQIKTVAKWEVDKTMRTIEIYKEQGGLYFKLLQKIYKDGAIRSLTNRQQTKIEQFNQMDSRDTDYWDIEQLERKYIERKLTDRTKSPNKPY